MLPMRGVVRMRGMAWVGVLGLVACTVTNPAYQSSDESAEDPTGDPMESGGTTMPGTTTQDGESSGATAVCELHPPRPLRIHVTRDGQPLPPPCGGNDPIMLLERGNSLFEGNTIIHPECLADDVTCLCNGVDVAIEIEGLQAYPVGVPSCGPITLWSVEGPAGCEWGGLMMQPDGELAPGFILSRTRQVPPLGPAFEIGLEKEEGESRCSGECDPYDPGRYMLDVVGELVPADGLMHFVEVSFLAGAPLRYVVENRMASITEECEEQLAWLATLDP